MNLKPETVNALLNYFDDVNKLLDEKYHDMLTSYITICFLAGFVSMMLFCAFVL